MQRSNPAATASVASPGSFGSPASATGRWRTAAGNSPTSWRVSPTTARRPRRGVPLVAWIVGGVALVGAGCVALALAVYFAMPQRKPREERPEGGPEMTVVSDTSAGDRDQGKKAEVPATQNGKGALVSDRRMLAPGEEWLAGPVSVQIAGVSVFNEDLMVIVAVKVADPKAKVSFRTWRDPLLDRAKVRLADDNGTVYRTQGFDLATDGFVVQGVREQFAGKLGMGSGAVYSNQPRADILLFERPTPAARHLDLDLDASHVGQRGTIRFRIPRSAWEKAEAEAPMPPVSPKSTPVPMPPVQSKSTRRPGAK